MIEEYKSERIIPLLSTESEAKIRVSARKVKPGIGVPGLLNDSAGTGVDGDNHTSIITDFQHESSDIELVAGEPPVTYHSNGYIRLPRSLLNDPYFQGARLIHQAILIRIISLMSWHPREFNSNGRIIIIQPGQVCISLRKLTEECGKGATIDWVRGAIKYFSSATSPRKVLQILPQKIPQSKMIICLCHKDTYDLLVNSSPTLNHTASPKEVPQKSHTNEELKELKDSDSSFSEDSKRREEKSASPPRGRRVRPVATEDGMRRATQLFESIRMRKENYQVKNLDAWALDIDKIQRLDGVDWGRLDAVLAWLPTSDFWWKNILSGAKLRQQFQRLEVEMQSSLEDSLVATHRRLCLQAKSEFPRQLGHMDVGKTGVVNTHNGKDVPFRLPTEQFRKLVEHVFQLEL